MILEFADQSQLEIKNIYGAPKLVDGVLRDTLVITVDPDTIEFAELRSNFYQNDKVSMLYTYEGEEKITIGEGYKIFVSISDERRKIQRVPGKMEPDRYEHVYVVTIAQMTYEEYHGKHVEE